MNEEREEKLKRVKLTAKVSRSRWGEAQVEKRREADRGCEVRLRREKRSVEGTATTPRRRRSGVHVLAWTNFPRHVTSRNRSTKDLQQGLTCLCNWHDRYFCIFSALKNERPLLFDKRCLFAVVSSIVLMLENDNGDLDNGLTYFVIIRPWDLTLLPW